MSHHKMVCEKGYIHGQCRFPNPNKTIIKIECPDNKKEN